MTPGCRPSAAILMVLLSLVPGPAAEAAHFLAPLLQSRPRPAAGWKDLFDGKSLAGWKATAYFRAGKVYVKDRALVLERGRMMTGLTYVRGDFPKTNYEVTLEGKKIAGNDFFCTTTFPVGDSFCSLVVGGWGGRVVGLSSINGSDASENATRRAKEFKTGRWYRIRIRVMVPRIEAWIDGAKLVDVDTEGLEIATRLECRPCQPFGIATWNTTGAVRGLRVRTLPAVKRKASAPNGSTARP